MRRHPRDVLLVLAGSLVVASGALAAHHGHVSALEANLFRLVNQLPQVLGRSLLGAMEAALVVGLTAAGSPAGPAIAAVLAFRLLTFWLPILPGWLAYRALRSEGTI